MARSLTAIIKASITGTYTNDSTGASDSINVNENSSLSNGTGANKAQRVWESTGRSISTGSSETLDLYDLGSVDIGAGAGLDALGQALAFTGIKGLYIKNSDTSTGTLTVGNESTAATWNALFASDTGSIALVPGASILVQDPSALGLAVNDSSNHLLKLADSSGGLTYDIVVIGI
jgi:hypothetical protein